MRIITLGVLGWLAAATAFGVELTENEKLIHNGVKELRNRMSSEQESARIKAFDAVAPNEQILQKIIGEENAKILWPRMAEFVKEMRGQTADMKRDYERNGTLKEIELINLRSEQGQDWTKKVAKEIPLYRATLISEKGVTGSSVYTVIDGKMYWIRGLDVFDKVIEHVKSGKK